MDKKLLLVEATTLLYRESQLSDATDNSASLIKPMVDSIVLPEVSVGLVNSERDTLAALKEICLEMCSQPVGHKYEAIEVLQRIRHATRDEESLYHSFREGIEQELAEEALKKFCLNLRQTLSNYLREAKIKEILHKASHTLKFKPETVPDVRAYIAEVTAELEPYQHNSGVADPAVVSAIKLSDRDAVRKAIAIAKDLNDERGILKFGFQGLNRMFQGGIRRGEFIVGGALQHNFKTGMSLSLFKHVALYNEPYMIHPKRKPALVRISFEDPLSSNLVFLYRNIFENKTGKLADVKGMPDEEIAKYVVDELSVNGYEIFMLHVNPSMWTYRSIIDYILQLESDGYEVHFMELDYLATVPTTGCTQGAIGADLRDMYRKIRDFCASKKIAVFNPHQLSTEAKMLIRQGTEDNFVKEIANKGYFDGCKSLDTIVDGEMYQHIVKVDGKSYLTIQRGKHRTITETPEAHKFIVLPFHDVGTIHDDIYGHDTTLKKPGGIRIDGGEEQKAFWDFSGT